MYFVRFGNVRFGSKAVILPRPAQRLLCAKSGHLSRSLSGRRISAKSFKQIAQGRRFFGKLAEIVFISALAVENIPAPISVQQYVALVADVSNFEGQ